MNKNVLIYDDRYWDEENEVLVIEINEMFPNVDVFTAGSYAIFKERVKKKQYDIFILDIMGAKESEEDEINGSLINEDEIGLTMLTELRSGMYPIQNTDVPIIIRSAKGDEYRIQSICRKHDVEHVFYPSTESNKLIIEILKNYFSISER